MAEQQQNVQAEPTRSRPRMPEGYGIPDNEEGMLAWSEVDEELAKAKVYWLGTASLEGEPHATPIWGAWVGGAVYFEGGSDTRWARNLAENPRIVVHIESGNRVIMLKGLDEVVTPDASTFAQIVEQFGAKFDYRPESGEGLHSVRPRVAMAWDNDKFPNSTTRWQF